MKVALFIPCYIDDFFPEAAMATLNVLEKVGCEVIYPENQSCCGQPFFNNGMLQEARPLAERFADLFGGFDYVVAMDEENLMNLREICPQGHEDKLCLLLDFSSASTLREVPDPYYGGKRGFEKVLELVEDASLGLLQHIVREHCNDSARP